LDISCGAAALGLIADDYAHRDFKLDSATMTRWQALARHCSDVASKKITPETIERPSLHILKEFYTHSYPQTSKRKEKKNVTSSSN